MHANYDRLVFNQPNYDQNLANESCDLRPLLITGHANYKVAVRFKIVIHLLIIEY